MVVALSNPVKLKTASTSPKRKPLPLTPRRWSCAGSGWSPWRTSTSAMTATMSATDAASKESIRRAEIFTSRQANHIGTMAISAARNTLKAK